jgi:hypothetical protein
MALAIYRDNPPAGQRIISDREARIVQYNNKLFSELVLMRNVFAGQWEEASALILPTSRNTFFYGSYNFPGVKKTQQQVDATGALALHQFCAIADSLITPKNRLWHGLESDEYVMKDRATREFFDEVRTLLFRYRGRASANFYAQNFSNWRSLGAFGNSVMFTDEIDRRWNAGQPGLRYRSVPLGECFFAENHQGIVTTLVRWFRLTAAQAEEKFGEEWLPPQLWPALQQNLQTPYNFLHCVYPRDEDDYDPERLDHRGMPFVSYYQSVEGQCLCADEGGFRTFPYAVSRYDQTPGEVYGRGPAQIALPGLKTLNAEKTVFLKQGHRAGDPIYLLPDDGIADFNSIPGAQNYGGVNADGKPLVHILETGKIDITEKMMLEERGIIENIFLTPLFKTLMQNPNMTATQVTELINERAMLVAPTLGRQHSEFVGSGLVPREIDLLAHMRDFKGNPIFPPMPPRLKEAGGHYEVTDTSPLALQARASQAAGGLRTLDVAHQIAINSGDNSVYDHFNFDTMLPAIGVLNEMPTDWTATTQELKQKRQNRAQAQQRQQAIEALPAQAAMVSAQAKIAKAPGVGGQQPQQQPVPA